MMDLTISNLTKVYPNGVKALDDLDLEIGTGMFGLLGPNGAGKSTLMRTVATLQTPDRGRIVFRGIDVLRDTMRLRQVLGYLPQDFGVYPGVSAENLLDYFARLKGIASKAARRRRIGEVLEITHLYEVRRRHVSDYSGGMRQRFGIAQLLLSDPQLIIVDEPTAGLDPAERRRFLNMLREIATRSTVIFSTHIVDDVVALCNDLAIMDGGRILQHQPPAMATAAIAGRIWMHDIARAELEAAERSYDLLSAHYNPDHSLNIRVYAGASPGPEFIRAEPNLEDVYFIALRENRRQ